MEEIEIDREPIPRVDSISDQNMPETYRVLSSAFGKRAAAIVFSISAVVVTGILLWDRIDSK